jgi:cytochrome bd-type quinol oxidase subunit 1
MEIAFLIFVSIFCGGGLGVASVSAWKYYKEDAEVSRTLSKGMKFVLIASLASIPASLTTQHFLHNQQSHQEKIK